MNESGRGTGRERDENINKNQIKGHIAFLRKILGLVRKTFF